MKKTLLLSVFLLCTLASFGQTISVPDAERGYYIKDSKLYNGVFINNAGKSDRAVRVDIPSQKDEVGMIFYPGDISGYGFPNGVKYVSADIDYNGERKAVFLEELFITDKEIGIYYYCDSAGKDVFYVYEDGNYNQVSGEFPEVVWMHIWEQRDCGPDSGIPSFPKKLNRRTVNVFHRAFRDCNTNMFRTFRYGPVVGLGAGKVITNTVPEYRYGLDFAFSVGMFGQLPLDECFDLRAEVSFARMNNRRGKPQTFGSKGSYERNTIQIPLTFRYTANIMSGRTLPYVEAGFLMDLAVSGKKDEEGRNLLPGGITPMFDESKIIKSQYGFTVGAGIERKLDIRRSLYMGIRFNYATATRNGEYREKLNYWMFTAAINL